MRIGFDTNVLIRLLDESFATHGLFKAAVVKLESRNHTLCLVPQNLIEFWAVATRPPANNGLGLSPVQAAQRMKLLEQSYLLLDDPSGLFKLWRELVLTSDVRGKQVHDTRLAAAYRLHDVTHLLTINARDFKRFAFLTCLSPEEVVSDR